MPRLSLLCSCALAGMVLAGTGCRSSRDHTQVPPTQSGLPEVTLQARSADAVKVVAAGFFAKRGYVETPSRHAYEMNFDKPTKGDRSGRALRVRLRLHKQTADTWRLVGAPLGVENWRSDLESELLLPQGASQIQGFLSEIKQRVEAGN